MKQGFAQRRKVVCAEHLDNSEREYNSKKGKERAIKLGKDLIGLRRPSRYKFFESLILAQD